MSKPALVPVQGFNWSQVAWGAPDQARTEHCSYCDEPLGDEAHPDREVPLIIWRPDGWCAEFCTACQRKWWGFVIPEQNDDDWEAPMDLAKDIPGYWQNETTGVLRPAITSYLSGEDLTAMQIAAIRAYLRQWIAAPGFCGPGVEVLRANVSGLTSRKAIHDWLEQAVEVGIDPL